MAVTKTDVANLALLKLAGQTDTGALLYDTAIASGVWADWTTGADDTQKILAFAYPFALKECLESGNWDFATKYSECGAELSGASLVEAGTWLYQFPLPTDYVKIIAQVDEDNLDKEYDHKVVANAAEDGSILLTNNYTNTDADNAYVEYVFLNDDPDTYSTKFIDFLATVLAGKTAPSIMDVKAGMQFEQIATKMKKAVAEQMDVEHEYEDEQISWFDARTA
jgi:hypothetical protein